MWIMGYLSNLSIHHTQPIKSTQNAKSNKRNKR